MSRVLCLIVALTAVLLPGIVEARTWKNQAGKEIEGEFLSGTATTVTLLMPAGEKVTFKLELLCKEDQEFVRETIRVKAAFGDENEAGSSSKPDAKKPASTVENRVWTDKDGRKVNARFMSVQGGMVTLRMGTSKSLTVPLANFSEADKQYVAQIMEARGESIDVPNETALAAGPNNFNSGLPGALRPVPGPTPNRNQPKPGGFLASKSLDNYVGIELEDGRTVTMAMIQELPSTDRDHLLTFSNFPEHSRLSTLEGVYRRLKMDAERKERDEVARVEREQADAERKLRDAEREQQRQLQMEAARNAPPVVAQAPTYTPPPTPSYTPPPSPGASFPSTSAIPARSQTPEPEGYCSSCNKPVPNSVGTGQRCPHCNVKFDYDETKGETASSSWSWGSGSSSGSSRVRIPVKGIIGLGVLVLGALGWIGRKLSGEE